MKLPAGLNLSRDGSGPASGRSFALRGRSLALAAVAVSALLGILWYFYLYTPTQTRNQQLRLENQQLNTEVLQGRLARAKLPELRAEVTGLRAERDTFLALLPEQNEIAELLDQLRQAARDARVDFTGLQNVGPASEVVPGVRLLNFSLATQGTYARTIAFLQSLEALPRFTRVQRVGLNADTGADTGTQADPRLAATYDFTIYVYTGVTAPDPNADPNAPATAEPTAPEAPQ